MPKNEVRIIGGKWRGRKLKFPTAKGLRPSQDRARETLFNWLAPWINDARVLDLFAGSGVLGFEALSRGAQHADLVDQSAQVVAALETAKQLLQANNATIHRADAPAYLKRLPQQPTRTAGPAHEGYYDLVFIDPPFASPLAAQALEQLLARQLLTADALVYLETSKQAADAFSVRHWEIFRDKAFGDSRALLLTPDPGALSPPNTC